VRRRSFACFAVAGLSVLCGPLALATAAPAATSHAAPVCKRAPHGRVGCFAIRLDRLSHGRVRHASAPVGYGPEDLQSAYALASANRARHAGRRPTVAVVDAYDDPTAAADLAVYRKQFGLPPCTARARCFRQVDQRGGPSVPSADPGWAEEISLDLDMVSAACPACRLLLVEADSSSQANLGIAVDTAVRLGADAVSNSYGGPDASDASYGRYYHHPGVAVTASAGDNGYGVSYPASSRWVTAVGGTTLRPSSRARRGWSETVWSGTGSGCSSQNSAAWQDPDLTGCAGRAVADVAAVADPATGVAVYDSTPFQGTSGWLTFGGTSAGAPIIAAVFALGGHSAEVDDGSWLWTHHGRGLNDVRSGANGTCPTSRWCTAHAGWDGPTGWGTPAGVGSF
jgi:subtilase family serine protease